MRCQFLYIGNVPEKVNIETPYLPSLHALVDLQ